MNQFLIRLSLAFLSVTAFEFAADAQIIVSVRPAVPVFVRPIPPSPRHFWVDGEWTWRGGRYVYSNGYWVMPRHGAVYAPGYWKRNHHGWAWKQGGWRHRR